LKRRDDSKTELIFQAMLDLVKEQGLAGITMAAVAKKAGLATGTVYIYFRNKEELINQLFTLCRESSAACYFSNYDPAQPFEQCFQNVWMNILRYRIKYFGRAVFMDQCYHSPFLSESTLEMNRQMVKPLFGLIKRGKREKKLKAMDTYLMLTFMIGCIHEGVRNAHYNNTPLTKTAIEQMYTLCWDGMKQ
jgi:AcrR family transcriptional regulator